MGEPAQRTSAFTDADLPGRYERLLGASLFAPWSQLLLDAVGVTAGARVLDVAAGTGVVSRAAARRAGPSGHVVSSDISPAMIAFNAGHAPDDGAAPVETIVASATDLGRPDGEFDVVVCQQGMPFFPDRPAAVREMRRVLRRGGSVGIAVWSAAHNLVPFGVMHGVLHELGAAAPFPGAFDDATYVLSAEQVGALLDGAGFEQVRSDEVELSTRWAGVTELVDAIHGTPFGGVLTGLDPDTAQHARTLLAERFAVWEQRDGTVAMPTYSVIARGRA